MSVLLRFDWDIVTGRHCQSKAEERRTFFLSSLAREKPQRPTCQRANCGKGEEAEAKLKACSACKLVKYCGRTCQIAHRPQHKQACQKRAAELDQQRSLAEICDHLECNPSPINLAHVITASDDQEVWIQVKVELIFGMNVNVFDDVFDVDVWKRFGRAVRASTLRHLEVKRYILSVEGEENGELLACIGAFFSEMKHSTSITIASFELSAGLSMDDMSEFILNNTALKIFTVQSKEALSLEQSTVLSGAIGSVELDRFGIELSRFDNDGSFEKILEGCKKLSEGELWVACRHNWQVSAVAAFLRDPSNFLGGIMMFLHRAHFDVEQALRDIRASLVDNAHLKKLTFNGLQLGEMDIFDSFNLLCDVSSIESIYNSNHTLRDLFYCVYQPIARCLRLNETADKVEVIRNKILLFHFGGEFGVSPFVNMPVLILPEILSQIEGNNKEKQSAIFRLLQCIPELCNVSERKSTDQWGNKRQKIGSVQNSGNNTMT